MKTKTLNILLSATLIMGGGKILAQLEQTLLSESWEKVGGNINYFYRNFTKTDQYRNVYVAGTAINSMGNTDILVQKYNPTGLLLWEETYGGLAELNDVVTAMHLDNNEDVILTGAIINNSSDGTDLFVMKFNSDGNQDWVYTFNGGSVDFPEDSGTDITSDPSGNYYVTGTSGNDTSVYDFVTISLDNDGNFIWSNFYDYANLLEIPNKIIFSAADDAVFVYGASQSSMIPAEYNIAEIGYEANSGDFFEERRSTNSVIAGINDINDIYVDQNQYVYLTGKLITTNGNGNDISVYKLNPNLSINWQATIDGHGLNDVGNGIKLDNSNNVYVTGYVTHPSLGKNVKLLKYDNAGTFIWERELQNAGQDEGVNLVIDANDQTFLATSMTFNGNLNIKIIGFKPNGDIFTSANYNGEGNLNDKPQAITLDADGDLIVVGQTEYAPGLFENKTVKYDVFKKKFDPEYINGEPIFNKNELLIRFNKHVVNTTQIDKRDLAAGELSDFVDDSTINLLSQKIGYSASKLQTFKIFRKLTTADSISISRLGNTVKLEPLWATLSVYFPDGTNLATILDSLETIKNITHFAERNHFLKYDDAPNDSYFVSPALGQQANLRGNYSGINLANFADPLYNQDEGGWEISTGDPSIKVGVYDTGVDWRHEDYGGPDWTNSRIKGGFDYGNNIEPQFQSVPDPSASSHGTACAGIIGAIRNNTIGIAGIAGGDFDNETDGVSLYSLRVLMTDTDDILGLGDVASMSNAIREGVIQDPTFNFNTQLDIHNHSWEMNNSSPAIVEATRLLRNVIQTGFKNEVIIVASSGNYNPFGEDGEEKKYPASYNDSWVMKVGASGFDGGKRLDFSNYNHNLDFVAPGQAAQVSTLKTNNFYGPFQGTSAAAPHVAGVAALMLSEHNPDLNSLYPNKLTQEDVEFILQKSAKYVDDDEDWISPFDLPLPNIYNGYGLINALGALQISSLPYRIRHFSNQIHLDSATLISQNDTIAFPEGYVDLPVGIELGNSDEYKINFTIPYTLPSNEAFIRGWVRNASCDLYNQTDSIFDQHWSGTKLDSITATTAYMSGYFYKTELIQSGNVIGYKFFPEIDLDSLYNFAFSVHTFDSSYNLETTESTLNDFITLFPNPSSSNLTLTSSLNDDLSVSIVSLMGQTKFTSNWPKSNKSIQIDIESLANGVYLVIVDNGETQLIKKFIKN